MVDRAPQHARRIQSLDTHHHYATAPAAVATRGAAHDQMFDVVCEIAPLGIRVQASGSSRRAAEQAAAGQAIVAIEALGPARRASRRRKPAQLSLPVAVAQDTPKSQKEQDKK